jgi:hypothetical protein
LNHFWLRIHRFRSLPHESPVIESPSTRCSGVSSAELGDAPPVHHGRRHCEWPLWTRGRSPLSRNPHHFPTASCPESW